jgi:hypothetical protein
LFHDNFLVFGGKPVLGGERPLSYHRTTKSGNTNLAKPPNLKFPNKSIISARKSNTR